MLGAERVERHARVAHFELAEVLIGIGHAGAVVALVRETVAVFVVARADAPVAEDLARLRVREHLHLGPLTAEEERDARRREARCLRTSRGAFAHVISITCRASPRSRSA